MTVGVCMQPPLARRSRPGPQFYLRFPCSGTPRRAIGKRRREPACPDQDHTLGSRTSSQTTSIPAYLLATYLPGPCQSLLLSPRGLKLDWMHLGNMVGDWQVPHDAEGRDGSMDGGQCDCGRPPQRCSRLVTDFQPSISDLSSLIFGPFPPGVASRGVPLLYIRTLLAIWAQRNGCMGERMDARETALVLTPSKWINPTMRRIQTEEAKERHGRRRRQRL